MDKTLHMNGTNPLTIQLIHIEFFVWFSVLIFVGGTDQDALNSLDTHIDELVGKPAIVMFSY